MEQPDIAQLSEPDQKALDALIDHQFDPSALSGESRHRADKLVQLFSLLDHLPTQSTGDLLPARTLQRIAHLRQQERFARQINSMAGVGIAGRLSLRDLVATAAMFLVSMSLLWPVLNSARSTARQIACQANLATAGMGLISYAAANAGQLAAQKLKVGDPWVKTNTFTEDGRAQSNSAHLFQLARQGFVPVESLKAETTSPLDQITAQMRDFPTAAAAGFSYQNQYTNKRPKLASMSNLPVIADRSPFFEGGKFHPELPMNSNSLNHGGRGQNVLMSDGHVLWLTSPKAPDSDDNIFHVGDEGQNDYNCNESPMDARDSFLVQ